MQDTATHQNSILVHLSYPEITNNAILLRPLLNLAISCFTVLKLSAIFQLPFKLIISQWTLKLDKLSSLALRIQRNLTRLTHLLRVIIWHLSKIIPSSRSMVWHWCPYKLRFYTFKQLKIQRLWLIMQNRLLQSLLLPRALKQQPLHPRRHHHRPPHPHPHPLPRLSLSLQRHKFLTHSHM